MEMNMTMKNNNASLWSKVARMFRRETQQEREMRIQTELQMFFANSEYGRKFVLDIADVIYTDNHGEIVSDLRESIDAYEIAQEFDTYDIAQELVDDVVYNLDMSHIADHIDTEAIARELEDVVDNRVSNDVENHFNSLDLDSMLADRMESVTSDISSQISDDIVGEVIVEIATRMVE